MDTIVVKLDTQDVGMGNPLSTQKIKVGASKDKPSKDQLLASIKDRKIRTRRLIELGGIVVKAKMDHLDADLLLGALIYAKEQLSDIPNLDQAYAKLGAIAFKKAKGLRDKVVVRFKDKPDTSIRQKIRSLGLKWDYKAQEWHGYISDMDQLKEALQGFSYTIQVLQ